MSLNFADVRSVEVCLLSPQSSHRFDNHIIIQNVLHPQKISSYQMIWIRNFIWFITSEYIQFNQMKNLFSTKFFLHLNSMNVVIFNDWVKIIIGNYRNSFTSFVYTLNAWKISVTRKIRTLVPSKKKYTDAHTHLFKYLHIVNVRLKV